MSLCFSAGEFACPVWHRSANAKQVDIALNETCRIISGCLKPTPLNKLYPLVGIAPPSVRRDVACAIEKKNQESDSRHPLFEHKTVPGRLKSRKSFLRGTKAILDPPPKERLRLWEEHYLPPPDFLKPQEHLPPGHELQWPVWKALNRLRTQVGRCKHNLAKWGFKDPSDTQCECGASVQNMSHTLECPKCPNTCTLEDLMSVTDAAISVATYWAQTI
ncbi:hypothetical protein PYW07_004993 [Mythimna separata]|uniref:Uncharacterized protein n=1 Tax=Mythimna separata TaxID=271217 RepID=A0AAD7YE31_MYTSE|nr:hypothetical protein PYW07_004993 [Mythimna separata]